MISISKKRWICGGLVLVTLCSQAFAASAKSQLQELLPQVQTLASQSDITTAVEAANQAHANLSANDIRTLGKQWHEGVTGKSSDLLNQVNSSDLTAALKSIQMQSNGQYAQIVVTDAKGLVIGQTYNADRYSQARSSIWGKIKKDGVKAVYYGKPKQSAQGNLATLGVPVIQNDKVIGAMLVASPVTASPSKKSAKE